MPSKRVWVFGSFQQNNFFQNSKAFYLYVSKHCPEIKAVWLTKNKDIIQYLRENKLLAFHCNSLLGIYYSLKADYHIVDWGMDNTNPQYQFLSKLINFWHGIPLKRLERDILVEPKYSMTRKKAYIKNFEKRAFGKPSLMLACSDYDKEKLSSAFNVPIDKIKITGFPRNDWLNDSLPMLPKDKALKDAINADKKRFSKVFLYMPTFRDHGDFDEFEWIDDQFRQFLEDNKCCIYIKGHIATQSDQSKSCDTIRNLNSSDDVYPLLNDFDCLITDYSSIYFDFALTGKQIIHFVQDLKSYESDVRGFYIDFEKHAAGDICRHVDDLKKAMLNGKNESKKIADMFHVYSSDFCKRIAEYLNNETI